MNFLRTCSTFLSSTTKFSQHLFQSSPYKFSHLFNGFLTRTYAHEHHLFLMHLRGPMKKKKQKKNPLGEGVPQKKGIVLRTLIKKPRKPNSANRKCVLIRLSDGRELCAYVPGEGHNLQEHSTVLVRNGRVKDTPGVKLKCIRGKYDLGHVLKGGS